MARTDALGRLDRVRNAVRPPLVSLARWAVGDRTGGALFLGSLLVYALGWQAGITILDTYAVANGMVAVADGHLHVDAVAFGPGFETPGMHYVDGRYYARNYGQIVAALPVYWLLEGLDAVTELRVAVAALWSLCLVWFSATVATLRGDDRIRAGGAVAALGVFLLNLQNPTPVPEGTTPLLALQLVTMVAAALCAVSTYRLLRRVRSYRAGVLGGALVAVGTPVAFWASIPKRHALASAVLFGVAYLLYRSRANERAAPRDPTTLRAGMYALVGLFAWVHAPVAVTLFLPLAAVDLATAPRNAPRDLAVVAGAFALSLVPFFLTNYFISGNPVQPPRLLPAAESVANTPATAADTGSTGGMGGPGDTGGTGGPGDTGGSGDAGGTSDGPGGAFDGLTRPLTVAVGTLAALGPMVDRVLGVYATGLATAATEPGRLYRVVLVSTGEVAMTPPGSVQRASNLSMLESTPVVGAALAFPVGVAVSRLRRRMASGADARSAGDEAVSTDGGTGLSPQGGLARVPGRIRAVVGSTLTPTDAFLVAFSALLAFVYLPRLPVQGQITMRYLTPLYPVAVYLVCRHRRLGDALVERFRTVAYAYEATVLLGVPSLLALVLWFELGEAATFDALAGSGVVAGSALALATVSVLATGRGGDVFAGLVGVAAGTTTGFVLLSQLVLFHYGVHLLPVVQSLTETIRLVLVRMTV